MDKKEFTNFETFRLAWHDALPDILNDTCSVTTIHCVYAQNTVTLVSMYFSSEAENMKELYCEFPTSLFVPLTRLITHDLGCPDSSVIGSQDIFIDFIS